MSRPAYSFCLCPDSTLLRTRIDALFSAHPAFAGNRGQVSETDGGWRRFVFWGDEGLVPAFWEHLTLQGLFATPKALIIRNSQTLPAETLKDLSKALAPLASGSGSGLASPLIWPVICLEVGFEKNRPKVPAHILRLPCYETAEAKGWLEVIPGLGAQTLSAFIRAEAGYHGLALSAEEVGILVQALPTDAAFVRSEIAKLALTADAGGRLPRNFAGLVGQTQELSIFELMRIVQQSGDARAAWRQILEDRLSGENMVFAFTAILLREARILWQCLAGTPPYLPAQMAMQKKIAAESLGFGGIARLWDLALMADKGIKTGERSPDQAFEILAADLFMLFSRKKFR